MAREDAKKTKHPSFGLIGISRMQTGGLKLFDSPLTHHQAIKLTISTAYNVRDLSKNWIHADEQLIEVVMSEAQFAQFITSANMGDGTPCTLRRYDGKLIPECPDSDTRKTFENEVKDDLKDLRDHLTKLNKLVEEVASKPRLTAEDKKALREAADGARRVVDDSLPFIHEQFSEAMDKTVMQAQTEFNAHVQSVIQQKGMEAIGNPENFPKLGFGSKEAK